MRHRRKMIFAILILVGFLCVVGTGFSIWLSNVENSIYLPKIDILIADSQTSGSFSYDLPSGVVLEEGLGGSIGSASGISFYKIKLNEKTNQEEFVVDVSLSISFLESELNIDSENLKFGFRFAVYGKLSEYIEHSVEYYRLSSIIDPANQEEFKDLRKLASKINFDETTNYNYENQTHTFKFTTTMLNSFFTYKKGKRPNTPKLYEAMMNDILNSTEKSYFQFELWQG